MHPFLTRIHERAHANPQRIVFAEGQEPRVVEAIAEIEAKGLAKVITFEDPRTHPAFSRCVEAYAQLREMEPKQAEMEASSPHTFATLLLHLGEADGMIAGPTASSKERILPALKIIKSKEAFHKVSGCFFMILPDDTDRDAANGGVLLFADCAVTIDPNSHDLADIAIDSAETARFFEMNPTVAMLSFSTGGSAKHPNVQKVQEATELIQARHPDLPVLGDVQVDAALMDEVGARKTKDNPLAGHANVLIFPDLEAGNIGYKLVERLAGATAIGPILQGLHKPVNELSRGCSAQDIVHLAAITSVMAQQI